MWSVFLCARRFVRSGGGNVVVAMSETEVYLGPNLACITRQLAENPRQTRGNRSNNVLKQGTVVCVALGALSAKRLGVRSLRDPSRLICRPRTAIFKEWRETTDLTRFSTTAFWRLNPMHEQLPILESVSLHDSGPKTEGSIRSLVGCSA